MGALTIEKVEVPAQRSARFCDGVVGLEVDLLVLHRSPEPLDEHVVAPGALAVHADGDPVLLKDAGERLAGELTALVAVENLRLAMFADGLLESLDAEAGLHRDRYPMRKHAPSEPVDDSDEIDEAARHRDIDDVPWFGRSTVTPRRRYG